MELECEICRAALAITLANGTPMCGKCRDGAAKDYEVQLTEVVTR